MWGGNQRAKDGGIDVRVKVDHAVELAGYIPWTNTIFQVKAVKAFTAATIMNEMTPEIKDQKPPSRQLLSCISELAQYFGSYIIASTKGDHSDSELRAQLRYLLRNHYIIEKNLARLAMGGIPFKEYDFGVFTITPGRLRTYAAERASS